MDWQLMGRIQRATMDARARTGGGIYSPGMECAPEDDDSAHIPYAAVNYHYAQ